MDSKQKVLNMIGLATRAGKVKSGEFSTENFFISVPSKKTKKLLTVL